MEHLIVELWMFFAQKQPPRKDIKAQSKPIDIMHMMIISWSI